MSAKRITWKPPRSEKPPTEEAISDQVHFIASDAPWKAFTKALDAPPRVLPKLKRLLSKPSLAESR